MFEFLGIDMKTLDDGGFQFFQTGLIIKVLEDTGMDHCNGLPTPTKVEAPLASEPFASVPRGSSTLKGVGNPLQ